MRMRGRDARRAGATRGRNARARARCPGAPDARHVPGTVPLPVPQEPAEPAGKPAYSARTHQAQRLL